ncbi:MAG: hypothetical protein IKM61_03915 [Eubacteriaceae bacterium]|nr:hypothetical protein [Eubacteriaceae bacterium]
MKITKSVYDGILAFTPPAPPERGGILGGKDGKIIIYASDTGGKSEYDRYTPDTQSINKIIETWEKIGIGFMGIYHSHFQDGESLSNGDIKYIKKIMSVMPEKAVLYFPLILPGKIIAYRAENASPTVHITSDDIEIIF